MQVPYTRAVNLLRGEIYREFGCDIRTAHAVAERALKAALPDRQRQRLEARRG